MTETPNEIMVEIGSTEADHDELRRITRQLRDQIREVDGASARLSSESTGSETGKGDPITIASLAVTLAPAVLPKLIDLVIELVKRGRDRKVTISIVRGDRSTAIEITGSVTPQQIDAYLASAKAAASAN
jgi:hypothetical protein